MLASAIQQLGVGQWEIFFYSFVSPNYEEEQFLLSLQCGLFIQTKIKSITIIKIFILIKYLLIEPVIQL
jgi:hypothetical protein